MDVLINLASTMKDALNKLDITCSKVLYVVDNCNRLIGSVTDGDIRRAMLRNMNIDSKIEQIMFKTPRKIYYNDYNKSLKLKKFFQQGMLSIPLVDENDIIIDIAFSENSTYKNFYKPKSNKVFIVAGGKGTRLEPFTKILPKPLIPLGDKAILERIMDKFAYYGFGNFILSVNYKSDMIKLYLGDKDINNKYSSVKYVEEEKPLGTIGSLYMAKDYLKEDFFISNADILLEEDLDKIFDYHKNKHSVVTIVGCIKKSIIPYGVLKTDNDGYLEFVSEKPATKFIINTGVYVAKPEIIDYISQNQKKDMTELIDDLLKERKKVAIYPIEEEQWKDIGQWEELRNVQQYFI